MHENERAAARGLSTGGDKGEAPGHPPAVAAVAGNAVGAEPPAGDTVHVGDTVNVGDTADTVDAVLAASRALVAIAARSLAEAGEECTLAQYRALVVLASRGPRSLAQLADALDVTPSTATRMCDRLIKKGLVDRAGAPDDRRRIEVTLTSIGRAFVDDVTRRRRSELARVLSSVPVEEQRSIAQSLGRFAAAAGEPAEADWTTGWDL